IMAAIADTVDRLGIGNTGTIPFVVDPVAASQHGDPLLRADALDSLRRLIIPRATLVTPNVGEIKLLTGVAVKTADDMRTAAEALLGLGATWALVKGGHLDGPEA